MGFWPFGREPADVEIVSRVVTATARNGFRVRARLTLHFVEAQTQADADAAADLCASTVTALLREAHDHESVIGAEAHLSGEVTVRYPPESPRVRGVEVASVHIVGDPGLSHELRRPRLASEVGPDGEPRDARDARREPSIPSGPSQAPPASLDGAASSTGHPDLAHPPGSLKPLSSSHPDGHEGRGGSHLPPVSMREPSRPPLSMREPSRPPVDDAHRAGPSSMPPRSSSRPPSISGAPGMRQTPLAPKASYVSQGPPSMMGSGLSGVPSMRRRASSQIRSLQSLLMPPGTPPAVMGQFVAPNVRDASARLFVGYLRAHDLVGVRRVVIDETSADLLASLVPASDAPVGGYEASRAGEFARWQASFGDDVMTALRHEVRVAALYFARQALAEVDVMQVLAQAVFDGIHASAFAEDPSIRDEAQNLSLPVAPDFLIGLATRLTEIAKTEDAPSSIAAAMGPLVVTIEDDLRMSAMVIKASSGV